jgi:hypothetical protein
MPLGALKRLPPGPWARADEASSKAPNALRGTETCQRNRAGIGRRTRRSKAPNALRGTETRRVTRAGGRGNGGSRVAKHLMPCGALKPQRADADLIVDLLRRSKAPNALRGTETSGQAEFGCPIASGRG